MELIVLGLMALVILWLVAQFYADWQLNREIVENYRRQQKYAEEQDRLRQEQRAE